MDRMKLTPESVGELREMVEQLCNVLGTTLEEKEASFELRQAMIDARRCGHWLRDLEAIVIACEEEGLKGKEDRERLSDEEQKMLDGERIGKREL